MKLAVRNFLGAKSVDIDIGPGVTAIFGTNEAGKSSTLLAAAVALSGNSLPHGLTKKDSKVLIHDGAEAAIVALSGNDDESRTTLRYVEGGVNVDSVGRPPWASAIACGLENIIGMPMESRAALLIKALKSEPDEKDLEAALLAAGWKESDATETALATLQQIASIGWDGAHKKATEKGQELKGAWRQITGGQYGVVKAGSWRPEGYPADLDMKTLAELKTVADDAQVALQSIQFSTATDHANRGLKEASAARHDELVKAHAVALEAFTKAEAAHQEASDELARTPQAGYIGVPCPHCHKSVVVTIDANRNTILTALENDVTDAKRRDIRMEHAAASGRTSRPRSCRAGTA